MTPKTSGTLPHVHRAAAVVFTLALIFVLSLGQVGTASAATVLETATAQVQISEDGSATIDMTYLVSADEAKPTDTETLSFSTLDYASKELAEVRVSMADGVQLETTVETTDRKTTVTVTLPKPIAADQELELQVQYAVPAAAVADGERLTVIVPVLVLDSPAAGSPPDTFTANLELPPGYTYIEGFPANGVATESDNGSVQVNYKTAAVPSLLRSLATEGDSLPFTAEAVTELILLAVIVLGAVALYFSFFRPHRRVGDGPDADATTGAESPKATLNPPGRGH